MLFATINKMIRFILVKKELFLLGIILICAIFFRFYQLGQIPAGLINDEADTGYDAYSILHTGHDQWNKFFPLTNFRGFGDNRPVLYTYLVTPSEKIFGLNAFAVRFPSAILGVLSVVLICFVGKKLFSSDVGLISALLLAVSPWAIGMSRVGIESNAAITLTLGGILAFLNFKKSKVYLIIGVLLLLLALYTYSAYTLFIPLTFLVIFIFLKKQIHFTKGLVAFLIIIFLIFLTPFIISHSAAHTRLSQVGFFNSQDVYGFMSVLNDQIGVCRQNILSIFCKATFNKPELFVSTYIKNYLSHFSLELLFLNGTTTQFAILPQRGLEYLFEAIIFIAGLFAILQERKKERIFVLVLLFLAAVPDAITGAGHYSRSIIMLPFLMLTEAIGFIFLRKLLPKGFPNLILTICIAIIFLYGIGSFWIVYTTYFKNNYSLYSQFGYQDLIQKIIPLQNQYDSVYVSRHLNDTKQYIYYLFYTKYDPRKFQTKQDITYTSAPDGWVSVDRIDNVNFVPMLPTREEISASKKNGLFVSNPVDFPKNIQSVFTVKDLLGNTIFEAVDQKVLVQYYKTHETNENL